MSNVKDNHKPPLWGVTCLHNSCSFLLKQGLFAEILPRGLKVVLNKYGKHWTYVSSTLWIVASSLHLCWNQRQNVPNRISAGSRWSVLGQSHRITFTFLLLVDINAVPLLINYGLSSFVKCGLWAFMPEVNVHFTMFALLGGVRKSSWVAVSETLWSCV